MLPMTATTSTHTCTPPLRPADVRYPALRIDGRVGDTWTCGTAGGSGGSSSTCPALKTPEALRWRPAGRLGPALAPVRYRVGDRLGRRSGQRAGVGGHVDGVLAQDLQRHGLQGALVGRGQHDRSGDAGLVGLQPAHRHHAPPVTGPQPGEGQVGPGGDQVVAQPLLVLQELRR